MSPHLTVEMYFPKLIKLGLQYDYYSAKVLDNILTRFSNSAPLVDVVRRFHSNSALILMPGLSLRYISSLGLTLLEQSDLVVVVDSAVNYLVKLGAEFLCKLKCRETFLVTDLDADMQALLEFTRNVKPVVIVHAHGDNIDRLKLATPSLAQSSSLISGTCQVLYYGKYVQYCEGFSDGDRAVHIARKISRKVTLIGFNPDANSNLAGKPITDLKMSKLKVAELEITSIKLDGTLLDIY